MSLEKQLDRFDMCQGTMYMIYDNREYCLHTSIENKDVGCRYLKYDNKYPALSRCMYIDSAIKTIKKHGK